MLKKAHISPDSVVKLMLSSLSRGGINFSFSQTRKRIYHGEDSVFDLHLNVVFNDSGYYVVTVLWESVSYPPKYIGFVECDTNFKRVAKKVSATLRKSGFYYLMDIHNHTMGQPDYDVSVVLDSLDNAMELKHYWEKDFLNDN